MDRWKGSGKGFTLTWAGALAMTVAFSAYPRAEGWIPPIANSEPAGWFAGLTVVGKDELSTLRGGFSLRGMDFEFQVHASTFVDGQLALESVFNLVDGTGPAIRSLPFSGASNGAWVLNNDTDSGAFPSSLDLSALAGANGLVITDSKGTTGVLHQVNRDQILSILINRADGRVIHQEFNVNVTVKGFNQFQQAVGSALLNNRIANAVNR